MSRAALLALTLASCAEDDRVCTLVGCDSGARFDLGHFGESQFESLVGATLDVCLRDACRQANRITEL